MHAPYMYPMNPTHSVFCCADYRLAGWRRARSLSAGSGRVRFVERKLRGHSETVIRFLIQCQGTCRSTVRRRQQPTLNPHPMADPRMNRHVHRQPLDRRDRVPAKIDNIQSKICIKY